MKKFLLAAAAVLFSAQVEAANVPLVTGVQEPSQLLGIINTLITNINSGTSGIVSVGTSAMGTFATTSELTLQSVVVPANTLTLPGQSLRARCVGTLGANTSNKLVRMYVATGTSAFNGMGPIGGVAGAANNWPGTAGATQFGNIAFGSLVSNVNGGSWDLELLLTNLGPSSALNIQNIPATVAWVGRGSLQQNYPAVAGGGTELVSPVVATSSALNWAQNITVNCAGTSVSTGAIGDISNTEIIIEQVK